MREVIDNGRRDEIPEREGPGYGQVFGELIRDTNNALGTVGLECAAGSGAARREGEGLARVGLHSVLATDEILDVLRAIDKALVLDQPQARKPNGRRLLGHAELRFHRRHQVEVGVDVVALQIDVERR